MLEVGLGSVAIEVFSGILKDALLTGAETERQVRLSEIQAALTRDRLFAQKEVLDTLIRAAIHVFDRKLDLLQTSFNSVLDMIRAAQAALMAEKADLLKTPPVSKSEKLRAYQRLGQIDREIAGLNHQGRRLYAEMQATLRELGAAPMTLSSQFALP